MVLQLDCTMLSTEPAREFATLQKTVGKEAHVVTPPIWHAGRIEIGYHESLVGG
jgi:predicted metal-dependent HD superfamily phosphohydrolase